MDSNQLVRGSNLTNSTHMNIYFGWKGKGKQGRMRQPRRHEHEISHRESRGGKKEREKDEEENMKRRVFRRSRGLEPHGPRSAAS